MAPAAARGNHFDRRLRVPLTLASLPMSLSSQLRADLESVAAALAACESILNRKTEDQETAEWLENYSRWAD